MFGAAEAQRLKLAGHLVEVGGGSVKMLPKRPAEMVAAALHPPVAPARTRNKRFIAFILVRQTVARSLSSPAGQ